MVCEKNFALVDFYRDFLTMPKRTHLSDSEKGEIEALRECGSSGREISKRIKRSKTVVYNFLKNPRMYGMKKELGDQKFSLIDREE